VRLLRKGIIVAKINIDLTDTEIWRILDAIGTYKQDYEVAAAVTKTIKNLEKKLKKALKDAKT
jgi:sulfur relay (sulfurtransferase) DsrC/TusE family protein